MCFCVDVRLGVCVTVRACGCVGGVCAAVWVHALKHVARAHPRWGAHARACVCVREREYARASALVYLLLVLAH